MTLPIKVSETNSINRCHTMYVDDGRCSAAVFHHVEFCFGGRVATKSSLDYGPPPNFFSGVENEQAGRLLGLDFPDTMLGVHLCIHSRGERIEMKPMPNRGERGREGGDSAL